LDSVSVSTASQRFSPEQSTEKDEESSFLRPGLPRSVLRDLRRGRWSVEDELDLHGLNSEQAAAALSRFLGINLGQGARCLRIVHGKGLRSPHREPVLRRKVKPWLAQCDEVLCFCHAPEEQGGSGALLVRLAAPKT
jgi:DNA-nicking Smr family endonuclease